MALYNVIIRSKVLYDTEIEAETKKEAREKAMQEWQDCNVCELDFWDTHVVDVYEV